MSDENEGGTPPNNQQNNQQKAPLPDSAIQGTFSFLSNVFDSSVPFKDKIWGIAVIAFGTLFIIAGYNFVMGEKTIFEFIREGRATLSSNAPPTLDPNKYAEIGKKLTKDGAKSVSIYEVDLGLAARKLVYAEIDGEQSQAYIEDRDSLYARLNPRDTDADKIRKANYNESVIRLQNGEYTCQTLEANARYGEFLLKNGVTSTCAIGLPTGATRHFVGAIVVGFDKELDSGQEDLMRSSLFSAAESILIKQ